MWNDLKNFAGMAGCGLRGAFRRVDRGADGAGDGDGRERR